MKENPLKIIEKLGQSVWLDYIRRDLITSNELRRLIDMDGLRGITSNPAIFEKAIAESNIYDHQIHDLNLRKKNSKEIYELISQQDVQNAADEFRNVYDKTKGQDGYVSLEVNPHLAHDTHGTIEEARRLWTALNRPNVFIKIPATVNGLPAIRQLISEAININVTLIFGLPRYRQVVEAYISGLEDRVKQGKSLNHIASVASLFLSRIDSLLDPLFEKIIESGSKTAVKAEEAHGQIAISSAKAAYQIYKEIFGSERFKILAEKGAHAQRLLWASTGTKNPGYSDIKYIEAIIGSNTVNTVPPETIDAYRDHGNPELRLEENVVEANRILLSLPELGIDIDKMTQQLEDEGVKKFNAPFDMLMEAITKKSSA
ncbi:MAG: transaldolase [Bacteroidales bacterium]|nr:transaldolase [Bacteroidales bacterium]